MDCLFADIYELLLHLGIPSKYVGFSYSAQAIYIAVLNPEKLHCVTKEIYMEVAKIYNTNWSAIEHAVRRIIKIAWKRNTPLLMELANYRLSEAPRAADFLSILSMHIAMTRMFNESAFPRCCYGQHIHQLNPYRRCCGIYV